MVSGSGFGTSPGEVHFVVGVGANGAPVDLVAPVAVWTDGQVFTSVPGTPNGGLIAFNGTVYIKRPDQVLSNLQPFAFSPLLDRRLIVVPGVPGDSALTNYNGNMYWATPDTGMSRFNVWCFWTENGDDKFFSHTLLKNGWKVYDTPATANVEGGNTFGGAPGAADIVASRVGTNSPYVDVSWWIAIGPFCTNYYGYSLTIPIEGPLGTSDGVVVQ